MPKHGNWNVLRRDDEIPAHPNKVDRIMATAKQMLATLDQADLSKEDRQAVVAVVNALHARVGFV